MADKEWIKNLATATWKQGKWEQEEPDRVRRLMRSRIEDSTFLLLQEAQDAAEIFNLYSKSPIKLGVLPLGQLPERVGGVIFMLGSTHASLKLENDMLAFNLTSLQGFQKVLIRAYNIRPQVDAFGSLVWQPDQAPMMGPEMIVKRVLEELIKQAHESGEMNKLKPDEYVR
jgi:hypothetical protein